MTIVLLIIIFITFISVGLPDSLLGTAWPAIYTEFDLPISLAGYITMTVSGFTVVSSLVGARLIKRFGTGVVTAASTVLTVAALFGLSQAQGIEVFFLLAIPLGLGAGAIDSALNSFVALHYTAAQMNYLQCFYGIGVTVSPYIMSLALGEDNAWRKGYAVVAIVQTVLALLAIAAIPLWKKVEKRLEEQEEVDSKLLSLPQMLKMPAVRWNCLMFFCVCAIELVAGGWCSTFFVDSKGLSPDRAALMTMIYYIGLSVGRFMSGALANKMTCKQMINTANIILLISLVLLMLPLGIYGAIAALFLAGFGIGPLFANLTHLTPQHFGRDVAQSIIGLQMAATYLGIMLMPSLFGVIADAVSTSLFPYYLLALFVVYFAAQKMLDKCIAQAQK